MDGAGSSDQPATSHALKPEPDERGALIDRIVASEPFQKSNRLPALLRYLWTHSDDDRRSALTEQAIGRAVFAKGDAFHPMEDSSVRVAVRQLRLRLCEYFQSAGTHEPLIVEIPKGAYALVFRPAAHLSPAVLREVPAQTDAEQTQAAEPQAVVTPVPEPQAASSHAGVAFPWILCGLALVVAAIASFGWLNSRHAAARGAPPWPLSAVVRPGERTVVVLADAGYALRMLGETKPSLEQYLGRDYLGGAASASASAGEERLLHYLASAQITSMADAHASAVLSDLSGDLSSTLSIRSARELTPAMLAHDNFVFVGAKTSNPWVELFEPRLNFHFVEDTPGGPRYILNTAPKAGEQSRYTVPVLTGSTGEDYATIALLPNNGDQGALLLIQGLRLEGTEAAIRFLASQERRQQLIARLRKQNSGQLPRYFEALLHAHSIAGSAVTVDCVSTRSR